jgi:hypothetical protein
MKWLLVSPQDRRRAAGWVGSGIALFVTAGLAGGLGEPPGVLFWGSAGFVSFVLCLRQAMALWRVDEMVFDHRRPRPENPAPPLSFRTEREPGQTRQLRHV